MERMSSITRSELLFPDPFAPNRPATARTGTGDPPSRHSTGRTYARSAMPVASNDSETSSLNDLAFSARKFSRTEA